MRGIEEIYRFEHWSSTARTRPSLQLVTAGKTYELGYVDESSMLFVGSRSYADRATFR
jgi:hypothetical protein